MEQNFIIIVIMHLHAIYSNVGQKHRKISRTKCRRKDQRILEKKKGEVEREY